MSIVKSILNVMSGGIIGEIGDAIDNNVTSDEERGKLHNALATIKAKSKEKTQEFEAKIEGNITSRHDADMKSDSKLAKNVRPLTLVVLTLFTLLYIIFGPEDIGRYKAGLSLLASLDMMVYGFYFGSRGIEKAAKSIADVMKPKQKPKEENEGELGW